MLVVVEHGDETGEAVGGRRAEDPGPHVLGAEVEDRAAGAQVEHAAVDSGSRQHRLTELGHAQDLTRR